MQVVGRTITPTTLVAFVRFRLFGRDDPHRHWVRTVLDRRIDERLAGIELAELDAVEVSGIEHQGRPWRCYTSLHYPAFDLCDPPPVVEPHDVVLCEQVLEHLADPWRAVETLRDLARPGGLVIVSAPFLLRIHPDPNDYWRFTEDGMRLLLERAGLVVEETGSWGNRFAVWGNLRRWRRLRPWTPLYNHPLHPVVVWAFARRPTV